MSSKQILKRGALMGLFFFIFYLLIIYNRDGVFSWHLVGEGLLAFVLFIVFYFLFGKFIRPKIQRRK